MRLAEFVDPCSPTEVATGPQEHTRYENGSSARIVLYCRVEVATGCLIQLLVDAVRFVRTDRWATLGTTVQREVNSRLTVFEPVAPLEVRDVQFR